MRSTSSSPVKPSTATARRIWIRQRNAEDNAWAATANLLVLMGVTVPRAVVRRTVSAHHAYPGLLAIIDALEQWGVRCEAAKGELNDLPSVTYPLIVQIEERGRPRFVVLWEIDTEARRISWLDPDSGWHDDSWDEFGRQWTGITLLAEPPAQQPSVIGDQSPTRDALARALPVSLPILGIAYTMYAAAVHRITWFAASMLVLYALGLAMSVLSVLHGLGEGLKRLCPAGKTINCRGVLESPASKLFGWLPVADLGVVYFSTGLLLSALTQGGLIDFASDVRWILGVAAWAAVPYAIFAIGYQAFRVKQWCWMCLVVQSTVIAMALSYGWPAAMTGPGHRLFTSGGDVSAVALAAAGFVTAAVWLTLRPLILARMANPALVAMNEKLENDPIVVESALTVAPLAPPYEGSDDIAVGDAGAPFQLVVVFLPQCGHCEAAYKQIVATLLPAGRDLLLCLRLMVGGQEASTRTAVVQVLEHLGAGRTAQALESFNDLLVGHTNSASPGPDAAHAAAGRLLDAQYEWVKSAGVESTPTFFLQGRRLPSHVTVKSIGAYLRKARRDLPAAVPAS